MSILNYKMKVPDIIKSFTQFEIILVVLFVFFLLLPIDIPRGLADIAVSPTSMAFYFIVTIVLFVFCHPVVGILYIFVAYEIVQRSLTLIRQNLNLNSVPHVIKQTYTNTKAKKVRPIIASGPVVGVSSGGIGCGGSGSASFNAEDQSSFAGGSFGLETEVVDKLAPIGQGEMTVPIESSYGPVYQDVGSASLF